MPSKDTPKYPLIRVEPPGPKAKELINLDEQLLMQSFSRLETFLYGTSTAMYI